MARKSTVVLGTVVLLAVLAGAIACGPSATPTPTSTPTPSPTPTATRTPPPTSDLSQHELKYQLISRFGDVFWCDPDIYPVAREGQEQKNALEQFPTIKTNAAEFAAILAHSGLADKPDYSDAEKLQIYREHKNLTYAVQMTPEGDAYGFVLRVGKGQGERIEGTITSKGMVSVSKREPSINTCPICLSKGTLIETPDGPVPVEQVAKGMSVWTVDRAGDRIAATVVATSFTPVPSSFRMVKVTLADGRSITASPGHPTADGQVLGQYRPGDALDGSTVVAVERVDYDGGVTYDLLPSGPTGLYWANGLLLKSTLAGNSPHSDIIVEEVAWNGGFHL